MNASQLPRGAVVLAAIAGGAIGTAALKLLGTPVSVLCLIAAIAIAHTFGWRLVIVRKRPGVIDV